jgi:hypothetical protein
MECRYGLSARHRAYGPSDRRRRGHACGALMRASKRIRRGTPGRCRPSYSAHGKQQRPPAPERRAADPAERREERARGHGDHCGPSSSHALRIRKSRRPQADGRPLKFSGSQHLRLRHRASQVGSKEGRVVPSEAILCSRHCCQSHRRLNIRHRR